MKSQPYIFPFLIRIPEKYSKTLFSFLPFVFLFFQDSNICISYDKAFYLRMHILNLVSPTSKTLINFSNSSATQGFLKTTSKTIYF